MIQKYQQVEPSIIAKYKNGMYHRGYFCGGSNIYIKLIKCEDKIIIMSKLQKFVLHWYHTYLLHPGMYITEVLIWQHLYCTGIRPAIWKEVTNSDTCQCTKWPNKKYGKLPANLSEKYHGIKSI